jgi:hypothetical protein
VAIGPGSDFRPQNGPVRAGARGVELILHSHFRRWATERPQAAFAWLHRAHWVLLVLSVVTILGAVAGSHGWSIF